MNILILYNRKFTPVTYSFDIEPKKKMSDCENRKEV